VRGLLGVVAEYFGAIRATIALRLRNAPPRLLAAWIAGGALLTVALVGLFVIGTGGRSTEPRHFEDFAFDLPEEADAATTATGPTDPGSSSDAIDLVLPNEGGESDPAAVATGSTEPTGADAAEPGLGSESEAGTDDRSLADGGPPDAAGETSGASGTPETTETPVTTERTTTPPPPSPPSAGPTPTTPSTSTTSPPADTSSGGLLGGLLGLVGHLLGA
jgi:hypothetical protein